MEETAIKYLKKNHIKLTQEEIKELFNDRDLNTETIVRSQMALVMQLSQHYHHYNSNKTFDEIVSDAMQGLLKAIVYYNPSKGVDFTAYAYTLIKQVLYQYKDDNNMIVQSRNSKKYYTENNYIIPTATSVDTFVGKNGDTISFFEVYVNEDNDFKEDTERYDRLCTVIKETLSDKPKWSDIVIATFGLCGKSEKVTQEDISQMYGISKQAVNQFKNFALKRLKNNEEFMEFMRETYLD